MGEDEKSKLFADCIKDLYIKKKYEVEYAILQLEKYKDAGKINASDYEENLQYFKSEKERLNTVEVVEENIDNNEENNTVDETVQDKENENKEVESAE